MAKKDKEDKNEKGKIPQELRDVVEKLGGSIEQVNVPSENLFTAILAKVIQGAGSVQAINAHFHDEAKEFVCSHIKKEKHRTLAFQMIMSFLHQQLVKERIILKKEGESNG